MALYGIDVSEFQGSIDWDSLNAVSNFVIMRASFGTARKDLQFDRNQSEARRVRDGAGPLGIGYYYFAYPELLDPITSANYFIDNLGELQPGELLALDLEGNVGADPVNWSLSFLQHCQSRTGVRPLIYLNQSLMNAHNWQSVIDGGFGLWLAQYDGLKEGPTVATPWPVVAVKQWTDADRVAGVSGNVDGDTFNGDFASFAAYGQPVGSVPAPAVPPVAPEPVAATPTVPLPVAATPSPVIQDQISPQPVVPPAAQPATGQPDLAEKPDLSSEPPITFLPPINNNSNKEISPMGVDQIDHEDVWIRAGKTAVQAAVAAFLVNPGLDKGVIMTVVAAALSAIWNYLKQVN